MAIDKRLQKIFVTALILIPPIYITGCAEINPFEVPSEVIKHPLGTDPIRLGMTKDEITGKWGKPDQVNHLETTDEWKTSKEEWVYMGRYSKLPLDRSYLFKTKYLVFEGNNLVYFGDEPYKKALKKEEQETAR